MNNYIYAQLNDDNIVTGISSLSGEIDRPDMLRISEYDETLLGKRYDQGAFFDVPKDPKIGLQAELYSVNAALLQLRDNEYLDEISGIVSVRPMSFGLTEKDTLIQRRKELLELLT